MIELNAMFLINELKCRNEDIFSTCVPQFLGRQNLKGHVVYGEKEKDYIGITDTRGNYFYIRYDNKNDNSIKTVRIGCEKELTVTTPLRLVVLIKEYNIERVHYKLLNDFAQISFHGFNARQRPDAEIKASTTNFEQIFLEETGKKEITNWNDNIALLAVDFHLTYRLDHTDCECIDYCCPIEYEQFALLYREQKTLEKILAKLKTLT